MSRETDQLRREAQMEHVEVTLLNISDARKRTIWKREELVQLGADEHLVEAIDKAIAELDNVHTRLMQGTYWYVAPEELAPASNKRSAGPILSSRSASDQDPVQASLL